jgi:hypothetical protein
VAAVRRQLFVVVALVAALAGCGGSGGETTSATAGSPPNDADNDGVRDARDAAPHDPSVGARAVRGKVDLEQGGAAVPDGGTIGGHHAEAIADTSTAALTVTGTVRPASARVSVRDRASGRRTRAVVAADGNFRLRLRGLRRGRTDLTLLGQAPGYQSWRMAIAVTRR